MLNNTVLSLLEEISLKQKKIIEELKLKDLEPEKVKILNKELDAISLFLNAIIKFRRTCR